MPGVAPKYNWTYPALVMIAREEGFAALYKGFLPKVLRLAPGGGVLLLVVEFTLGVFRQGTCSNARHVYDTMLTWPYSTRASVYLESVV